MKGTNERLAERALFLLKLLTQGFGTSVLLLAFSGLVIMIRELGIIVCVTAFYEALLSKTGIISPHIRSSPCWLRFWLERRAFNEF